MATWPKEPEMSYLLNLFECVADRIQASTDERLDRFVAAGVRYSMRQLHRFIPGLDVPPDPEAATFLYRASYTTLEDGNAREALARALRGLSFSPHHSGLWYIVASAYFEFGAVEDGIICLRHALWIHPGYTGARRDLEALARYLRHHQEDWDSEEGQSENDQSS